MNDEQLEMEGKLKDDKVTTIDREGNEHPSEEAEPEPVFDGTEIPGMESWRSISSRSMYLDSAARRNKIWPSKTAVLKNYVRNKSMGAVSTLMRHLSRKGFGIEEKLLDDEQKEGLQESEISSEKSNWNPLGYFGSLDDKVEEVVNDLTQPLVTKGRVILYTALGCHACREARKFLYMKRLRYVEVNINVYPGREKELKRFSGFSTVPKIFFNEVLIGGLDEIKSLDGSGKLKDKLEYLITERPSPEAPLPCLSGEDDVSCSDQVDELAVIVKEVKQAIVVKHRFYKMRWFDNCFVGSEAVDFLSENQYLEREEAVEFRRKLVKELFFQHILEENIFEDNNHLYRFLEHDPVVATQCYNIPRGILEVKKKPLREIASRLSFISNAIFEAYTSEDRRHVDYRSIHGSEEFAKSVLSLTREKISATVDKLGNDSLINCAKTSMSSKLIAGDSDFFANLVVDAVQAVKVTNASNEVKYPIKGINILKAHGQSARDSYQLNGYALNTGRAAQGMPVRVGPAKIACLDFNLQKTKMQLGVQVLVSDPRELEKIRQREADMTKERIGKLLKAGANVMLTTKGIDDMALKHFVEAEAIAVRRVRKEDMRRIAKATGATMVSTFSDEEGEETFDASQLGYAVEVVEECIANDNVIMTKGTKTTRAVSLILRGANDFMLDEMERALHDALCIVKRTLESNKVVAGGGAVEAALSVYLEHLATTKGIETREQLAITEFAESLLIIPKVLAVNEVKDATELVAKLQAYHHTARTNTDQEHLSSTGLDLTKGIVLNNLEAGVIEPAMSKVKIIQFATEAAITILRIDDMVKLFKDETQNED